MDAFLEAEDTDHQQHILTHPEHIIWDQMDLPEDPYDSRLSCYGNELMHSIMNLFQPLDTILSRLGDSRMCELTKTEKVIIIPYLRKVSGYAEKLSDGTRELEIPKTEQIR